ncbi:MAG: hypothetical protein GWN58_60570 [Anaerolineae bacterium]|nr:hypothetical protein [Anaerolineae bacterium]
MGLAVLLFVLVGGRSLLKSASRHATVTAMAVALIALLATATVALYLLFRFGWHVPLAHPLSQFHIGWGAVGWIGGLVIGVAYQVVPMFQITPEYPRWLRRGLVPGLGALLVLWPLVSNTPLNEVVGGIVMAMLVAFALQTLYLQQRRRRRLADVTLDFWRLSMVSLILAALAWLANLYSSHVALELAVGVLFLLGFAGSAVNGMLYKIVPFLIWLHLNMRLQQNGRRQVKVPNMKQVIPARPARWQFRLHLTALLILLIGIGTGTVVVPPAIIGLAWLASSGLLWWNLLQALQVYRRVLLEAV